MLPHKNFSQLDNNTKAKYWVYLRASLVSLPTHYHDISLHLSDCSTFDSWNHWIFDAAVDLAKTSSGNFRSLGKFPFKRCRDKTLFDEHCSDFSDKDCWIKNWTTDPKSLLISCCSFCCSIVLFSDALKKPMAPSFQSDLDEIWNGCSSN